jgi:hypothetical protein
MRGGCRGDGEFGLACRELVSATRRGEDLLDLEGSHHLFTAPLHLLGPFGCELAVQDVLSPPVERVRQPRLNGNAIGIHE